MLGTCVAGTRCCHIVAGAAGVPFGVSLGSVCSIHWAKLRSLSTSTPIQPSTPNAQYEVSAYLRTFTAERTKIGSLTILFISLVCIVHSVCKDTLLTSSAVPISETKLPPDPMIGCACIHMWVTACRPACQPAMHAPTYLRALAVYLCVHAKQSGYEYT